MKIITASAEPFASATVNPSQSELDGLAQHHPANTLYTLSLAEALEGITAVTLRWRHPHPNAQGLSQAALGCAVDCVARLAATPVLGDCDLAESELRCYQSFNANVLLARVHLTAVDSGCATYHCDVYALEKGRHIPVADSQGTLTRRVQH